MEQQQQRLPIYMQAYRRDRPLMQAVIPSQLRGGTSVPTQLGESSAKVSYTPESTSDSPQPSQVGLGLEEEEDDELGVLRQQSIIHQQSSAVPAAAPLQARKVDRRKQRFPSPEQQKRLPSQLINSAAPISFQDATRPVGVGTIKVILPISQQGMPSSTSTNSTAGVKLPTRRRSEFLHPSLKSAAPALTLTTQQIIQRIATPEGWDAMGEWLRSAERAKDNERLKTLLAQCLEADVGVELLERSKSVGDEQEVSMPKFIQQLSKRSADPLVSRLATQVVAKWKKVIKEADTKGPATKRLKHHVHTEPNILDRVQQQMDANLVLGQSSSAAQGLGAASTTGKQQQPPKATAKTSTVKTKMSNRRLTGLEGEDETSGDYYSSSHPRSSAKKGVDISLPQSLRNLQKSQGQKLPAEVHATKRERDSGSDMFMDALNQQAEANETAAKRSKIVRKKLTGGTAKAPSTEQVAATSPVGEASFGGALAGTLYADTSAREGTAGAAAGHASTSKQSRRKKVSFADDKGVQLVHVRFFDSEKDERVNVTKMSSEEMKHMEMKQEGLKLRETKTFHTKIVTSMPMPPGFDARRQGTSASFIPSLKLGVERPWKLHPLDLEGTGFERGRDSQSRLIELQRQSTVLEAFYSRHMLPCEVSELDEVDRPNLEVDPPMIPLELIAEDDEEEEEFEGEEYETRPVPIPISTTSSLINNLPLPPSASTQHQQRAILKELSSVGEDDTSSVEILSPASPTRDEEKEVVPPLRVQPAPPSPPLQIAAVSQAQLHSPEGPDSPEDTDIRGMPMVMPPRLKMEHEASEGPSIPLSNANDPIALMNLRVKESGIDLKVILNKIQSQQPAMGGSPAVSTLLSANKQLMDGGKTGANIPATTTTNIATTPTPIQSQGGVGTLAPTMVPQPGVFASPPPFQRFPTHLPPPGMGGVAGARPSPPYPPVLPFPPPQRFSPPMMGFNPATAIPPTTVSHFTAPPPSIQAPIRLPINTPAAGTFDQQHAGGGNKAFGNPPTSTTLPPPGLIQSLPNLASAPGQASSSPFVVGQQSASIAGVPTQPAELGENKDSSSARQATTFTTLPATEDPSAQNLSSPTATDMHGRRAFVAQCRYYKAGSCRFGEECLFAHGTEPTAGIKRAMVSVGSSPPMLSPQRGRGGRAAGYDPRQGGGRNYGERGMSDSRGGSGGQMVSVGGGIEISYDRRENRVRAWQVPSTHVMVTGGRGGSMEANNFFSMRGGYRGNRGNFQSERYGGKGTRRRSRSRSISPIRRESRRSRSKSRSRSSSPSRSRSPGSHQRRTKNNDERDRRGDRRRRSRSADSSPEASSSARKRGRASPEPSSRRRSDDNKKRTREEREDKGDRRGSTKGGKPSDGTSSPTSPSRGELGSGEENSTPHQGQAGSNSSAVAGAGENECSGDVELIEKVSAPTRRGSARVSGREERKEQRQSRRRNNSPSSGSSSRSSSASSAGSSTDE